MFLFKQKIKGIKVYHPFNKLDLPEKYSDADMQQIVRSLKESNESNRSEIIKIIVDAHLRLAMHIVGQYAVTAKSDIHDLVSEAVTAIIVACHDSFNGKLQDNNITGFIAIRIHSTISEYLKYDHVMRKPKIILEKLSNQIPERRRKTSLIEFYELLDLSIENDQERQVIELRGQELIDREIAEIMNLSISRINQIRKNVEKRFIRLEKGI